MGEGCTLVTGASSGIGRAIAERLSPQSKVVLHGRDEARLTESAASCEGETLIWQQDLQEVEAIEGSLRALLAEGCKVTSLVHCAGMVKVLPARSFKPAYVQQMMAVNVFSAMELCRLLLKKKLNQGALESIVFLSSIYSIRGARGHSVYAASKGALDAYMRTLAVELAPQVRVNAVLAGGVRTPMSEAAFRDEAVVEQMQQDYPLGLGEVSDIVDAVEFLVSDKARWVTGQSLVVDGGRTSH